MQILNNNLPHGWVLATLGDMVRDPKGDFVDGPFGSNLKANEYRSEGIPVFKIQNIKAGYFLDKNIQFVSPQKADLLNRHSFKLGDLIVTKLGEPLGLCCKVPNKYPEGIIVADLMRIRPSSSIVDTDYLVYLINSKQVQDQFKEITKGTTRARVNLTIVRGITIPLPPLKEQRRIVAKIEELLSKVRHTKEQLTHAEEQLSTYRQAILKNAFEGKLTSNWRKSQQSSSSGQQVLFEIKKNRKLKAQQGKEKTISSLTHDEKSQLPKLPKGWVWCRNEELLDYTTSGSRDWKQYYSKTGALFIRTQDIKTNILNLTGVAKVKLPKKVEGKRSLVEVNDLLMTITGANVGKVAHVERQIGEAYVSQSVALMKFIDKRISRYLFYYFQAKGFGGSLIEKMVYGVGRPVLSLENMKDVPVCICSIEEQNKIVEELDSQLSICDKLEDVIFQKISEISLLEQSILKRAFEGKLTEQNDTDISAEVSLHQLKKEREEYLQMEKKRKNQEPKREKNSIASEQYKSIIQILTESKKPVSTFALWKNSEHHDDIDAFYANLKKHINNNEVKEIPRKGKDAFITIAK